MTMLRETLGTLRLSLVADLARPRHLLLVVSGFFIASVSLVGLLSIPAGLDRMAGHTGLGDVALVLSATAPDETGSALSAETVGIVSSLPGIARTVDGRPLVAPQYLASVKLRRTDGSVNSVVVRGVSDATWVLMGTKARIVTGRRFKSGTAELLAGQNLVGNFVSPDANAQVTLRGSSWPVSGAFSTGGSLWDSELWTDIGAVQSAFNAQGSVSVLWVKLTSADAYIALADAIHADPRLQDVRIVSQRAYYARHVGFLVHFSRIAVIGIGFTLGLGAILAIANALTMALGARRRETAVLRAIGFRSASIGIATLLEVLLIGALSTVAAIVVAWLLLDGMPIGTSTGSQAVIFNFSVPFSVMLWSLAYSLCLGLFSAFWPTLRIARAPLIAALRAT